MEVFGAKFTPTARNPRLPVEVKTYLYKITPVSTEESSWTAFADFGFRVDPTTTDASVVFIIGKSAFVASGRSEAPVRQNLRVATLEPALTLDLVSRMRDEFVNNGRVVHMLVCPKGDTHRLLGEYFPEHQLV